MTVCASTQSVARRALVPILAMIALLAASCGGGSTAESSSTDVNIVDAGTINVELPDEIVAVEEEPTAVVDTAAGSESASGEADETEAAGAATDDVAPAAEDIAPEPTEDPDAIPLEQEEAGISDLLDSFEAFSNCLDDANYPEDLIPNGPDDQETFAKLSQDQIDTLVGCAASSQILQTLEDVQAAGVDRTAEEIEADNEATLAFVDCARGIGWQVSDPVPDQDGSLQLGGGPGAGLTPPPGEDFTSPGFRECVLESERISDEARENLN